MLEKVRQVVDKILVLKPYLKLLSEGRIFKLIFSWFLRIVAVVFALDFIIEWITKWEYIFKMTGSLVLMLTIIMFLAVAAAFAIINVILVKADTIADLPESKDYIVIPIAVVFIKMIGEISAFVWTFLGLAGFLIALTETGAMVLKMIPFFGGSGFVGGLAGLVIALIAGFFSFFLFYFIAEQVGVFADIARNTKRN